MLIRATQEPRGKETAHCCPMKGMAMSEKKVKSPLERVAAVLEAAQFTNGSLDITLNGPEGGVFTPLKMVVYLQGEEIKSLCAEISGVATSLQNIADAIRGRKND